MLSSYNSGKYFTQTYNRDKNDALWDSEGFTDAELSFLDVTVGEGKIKAEAEALQEKKDGSILYIYGCSA